MLRLFNFTLQRVYIAFFLSNIFLDGSLVSKCRERVADIPDYLNLPAYMEEQL